jgi:hypothetical protein
VAPAVIERVLRRAALALAASTAVLVALDRLPRAGIEAPPARDPV